jgi:hypothetical protein
LDDDGGQPITMEADLKSNKLEELMQQLFHLQDLNGNGVLEEDELIKLNEKIAMLHYGRHTDRQAVKNKFRDVFRSQLNEKGEPATYDAFRVYMFEVLEQADPGDTIAQEMILEQFIAEAMQGRAAFHQLSLASISDAPWMPSMLPSDLAVFGDSRLPQPHEADAGKPQLPRICSGTMPTVPEAAEDTPASTTANHLASMSSVHFSLSRSISGTDGVSFTV